jgi:hypothetical protein
MQVTAFNTPEDASWRWRIVNYADEVIAESEQAFPSIHAALAHGKEQLATMNVDQAQEVTLNWRTRHPPPRLSRRSAGPAARRYI